jgi:hypothetical protein
MPHLSKELPMPWQEIPLVEAIGRTLAAVAEPSNPSSLVLACVGIGTFLFYRLLARPGHQGGRPIIIAKPRAAVIAVEISTEERRVA